jgi:hypothetical protein
MNLADEMRAKIRQQKTASQSAPMSKVDAMRAKIRAQKAEKPISIEEQFESAKNFTGPGIEQEYSLGERAMQGLHGLAQGTGELLNFAGNAAYNLGRHGTYLQATEDRPQLVQPEFKMEERLPEQVSKMAGRDLTPRPEDTVGQFAHKTGQFLAPPYFGAGKATKEGAKALGKFISKEAGMATGAAGALTLTPSLTEEGTGGRSIEDLAKIFLGSKVPGSTAKFGKFITSEASKGNLIGALKEGTMKGTAKALSSLSKPSEKVFEAAKKYGINLPANVGMDNPVLNFLHNNVYKSIFTNKVYKKVGEEANNAMMKQVKGSIDKLGSIGVQPKTASDNFSTYLKNEKEAAQEKVSELYNNSKSLLKPDDVVIPANTNTSLDFINNELSKSPYLSDASKKVLNIVNNTAHNMGLINNQAFKINNQSIDLGKFGGEQAKSLLASLKSTKPQNVEKLIALRSNLMETLNYSPEVKGRKGLLKGLVSSIDKDIDTVNNKEFLDSWRGANKFKKDVEVGLYQSDMANSLLSGKAPREAFNQMDTIQGIRDIEKIANETSKGRELFHDLKAAKAREILGSAIQGSLETGDLKHGQFAKIFTPGNETQQELLKELIGKEEFKKLSEIAEISESFSRSGRDLLNTSGTAIAAADINKVEKIVLGALGFVTLSNPSLLLGAGAHAGSINLSSKLLSNQKFVAELRKYALERQRGNEKHAKTILERLINMGKKEQSVLKYSALHENEKKEKD